MKRRTRITLRVFAFLVFLSYLPMLVIHSLCIFGFAWQIAGVECFLLIPFLALPVGLIASIGFLFKRLRPAAGSITIVCALLLVLLIPVGRASGALRMYGFQLAAKRAEPLVLAIKAYHLENGNPPDNLSALVPEYIASIPNSLPPLGLATGEYAENSYYENPWALSAMVRSGILNWDMFIYLPKGNYPKRGYGGVLQRVEDWAYVHE